MIKSDEGEPRHIRLVIRPEAGARRRTHHNRAALQAVGSALYHSSTSTLVRMDHSARAMSISKVPLSKLRGA